MKAVIAAGGFATRFLPASKAVPKEMLPVLGIPMIHHQVRMLLASGITDILIVVHRGADIIHNYFSRDCELEDHLGPVRTHELLGELAEIRNKAMIAYTYELDCWPYGDAEAVMAARPWVGNEAFYCCWSDDIVKSEVPIARQVKDSSEGNNCVVAVQSSPPEESRYWGSVVVGAYRKVLEIASAGKRPEGLAQLGHFIFTHDIYNALDAVQSRPRALRELWIGEALQELANNGKLAACEVEGEWIAAGDLQRYYAANVRVRV